MWFIVNHSVCMARKHKTHKDRETGLVATVCFGITSFYKVEKKAPNVTTFCHESFLPLDLRKKVQQMSKMPAFDCFYTITQMSMFALVALRFSACFRSFASVSASGWLRIADFAKTRGWNFSTQIRENYKLDLVFCLVYLEFNSVFIGCWIDGRNRRSGGPCCVYGVWIVVFAMYVWDFLVA